MHEVVPKFHTPRDPSRRTLGTRCAAFGDVWLGAPFMPWQREHAAVAGELLDDGRPAYPLVVTTIQRQAGKSHEAMAANGERAMSLKGFRSWYTAQTGRDARDQFLKFHDDVVVGTPLERVVRTLRGNGHEVMQFPNGSTIRPFPPVETALHGKQSDRVDIDEGWAFGKDEGDAIMQAIGPTQLTRPRAQVFVWSAGGTPESTWLAELVARGRAGDPSICYVEYGIPDELDVDDIEAVAAYHPAVGHTITVDSLRALRTLLPDKKEFARAAGNRWTDIIGGAISEELWERVRDGSVAPESAPVGYGVARSDDGRMVAIVAAVELDDRSVLVELLETVPSGYRAAERVLRWAGGATVAVARGGASAAIGDELVRGRRGGAGVLRLSTSDQAAACGQLLDALPHRGVRFRPSDELDAARKVAGLRTVDGGGKVWAQRVEGSPVAPLDAATMAVWAVRHRVREVGPATVRVPGEQGAA